MTRKILGLVAVTTVALAGAGSAAQADLTPGTDTAFRAEVVPVATITSHVQIAYDFVLYNCPPGVEIVVDDWQASEPNKPDAGALIVAADYGLSTGEPVQRLVAGVNQNAFLADEQWVGQGEVSCGPVTVPVTGSGQARSINGA
jgi:hypothetical protein